MEDLQTTSQFFVSHICWMEFIGPWLFLPVILLFAVVVAELSANWRS